MKTKDIVSKTLFWLGLLICIGGIAVLEYLGFGRAVVWVDEFDRVTAATVIGIVMMAASLVTDFIGMFKKSDKRDE